MADETDWLYLVAEFLHHFRSPQSCQLSQMEKVFIFVKQPDTTRKSDCHTQDIPLSVFMDTSNF